MSSIQRHEQVSVPQYRTDANQLHALAQSIAKCATVALMELFQQGREYTGLTAIINVLESQRDTESYGIVARMQIQRAIDALKEARRTC